MRPNPTVCSEIFNDYNVDLGRERALRSEHRDLSEEDVPQQRKWPGGGVASSQWGFGLQLTNRGVGRKPQLMLGMVSEALISRNHNPKVQITTA